MESHIDALTRYLDAVSFVVVSRKFLKPVRRWFYGVMLPSEVQTPKILAYLVTVENSSPQPCRALAVPSLSSLPSDVKKEASQQDATREPVLTGKRKEIKNKNKKVRNNVNTTKPQSKTKHSTKKRLTPPTRVSRVQHLKRERVNSLTARHSHI